jgi:hypothetical protein
MYSPPGGPCKGRTPPMHQARITFAVLLHKNQSCANKPPWLRQHRGSELRRVV